MSHKIIAQRTVLIRPAAAMAVILTAALLGACSSGTPATKPGSGGSSASTNVAAVASLHAMLPDGIKSSGELRVASTFGYPPDEFYAADNKTPTGISVDLGNAVAGVLGLKAQFSNVAFDSILPGLLADRYDTVIGALSATPERVQQFNMVTYQNAGAALLVSGGNPKHIASLEDLCGLTVALLKGSAYIKLLQGKSDTDCAGKGKAAIKLSVFDGSADYFQAVASGRADATYTGFEAAKYAADNSGGRMTFIDKLYPDIPFGAAFTKQNLQLAKAVQAAFNEIIKNGTYGKIMDKWGVAKEEIDASSLMQANG